MASGVLSSMAARTAYSLGVSYCLLRKGGFILARSVIMPNLLEIEKYCFKVCHCELVERLQQLNNDHMIT